MSNNFGIIAAIDWNSNSWKDLSTKDDLKASNFGYVKEHNITYTCINFGHEIFPVDEKGYFQGLLPQLWSKTLDKDNSKNIKVVFIKSYNWKDKQNYLVGLYAFPEFKKGTKRSPIVDFSLDFEYNIQAFPTNIILFDNYINLHTHVDKKKFLPKDKKLSKQGFNYLLKENVLKMLDSIGNLNPNCEKFKQIKYNLLKAILT